VGPTTPAHASSSLYFHWPSTDFAEAHWFGCAHVITAIEQGKAALTNSFLLTGTTEDDTCFDRQPTATD
jgi:hypothetical protein